MSVVKGEDETQTKSEDDEPRSDDQTQSRDETPKKSEDETTPQRPPGWFRRNLRGFVVGVLASLVAWGVVSVGHRFFDHPPDKRVGEPVELGSFRYTVNDVTCGAKTFDGFAAHGKYCIATVDVVNITHDAGSPYPTSWILEVGDQNYDPQDWTGRGFSRLYPGEGAQGEVAFDVPLDAAPTALVIHDILPASFLGPSDVSVRVVL